jgi:hypothetical protein
MRGNRCSEFQKTVEQAIVRDMHADNLNETTALRKRYGDEAVELAWSRYEASIAKRWEEATGEKWQT